MLAWVLLVANMPTIVCTICSAFLAYKERPQWVWFRWVGGARRHRRPVDAQRRARATAFIRLARVREGRTPCGPRHEMSSGQVRP